MTILWCGGEDIDFSAGVPTANGGGSSYRPGFARCSVNNSSVVTSSARSIAFSGGAVTSFWLHAQLYLGSFIANSRYIGLAQTANGTPSGLYVGNDSSGTVSNKLALWKLDGTTWTELASEVNTSLVTGPENLDMHVANFGASATVNIYLSNNLVLTYSGSTTISGVSNLDCVSLPGTNGGPYAYLSEVIVTDTVDTRAMSLLTMAPNAAGDVNNWTTGTYANINPTAINDASVIAVNTTGQDFQANLIDLPAGSFGIVQAVKAAVRSEITAGAVPTSLKIGVKTNSTVNVDAGHAQTTAFLTYERLMPINPVTSAAWLASEMNPLQIDLQSA